LIADFAMSQDFKVNGDGSVTQTEDHFDTVFESIALGDTDEYPQPKEGKDIELGWDVEHMTRDDFKELKLRAQRLF
jgi:hypothetical protein